MTVITHKHSGTFEKYHDITDISEKEGVIRLCRGNKVVVVALTTYIRIEIV